MFVRPHGDLSERSGTESRRAAGSRRPAYILVAEIAAVRELMAMGFARGVEVLLARIAAAIECRAGSVDL